MRRTFGHGMRSCLLALVLCVLPVYSTAAWRASVCMACASVCMARASVCAHCQGRSGKPAPGKPAQGGLSEFFKKQSSVVRGVGTAVLSVNTSR